MRNTIQRLSSQTINQIAAGEVIEQPASVVKELVDNAIDAGASKIIVELRGGGRELIAVQDDGFGMSFEEAPLAMERHATSKLRSIEDLDQIASMGFRGEALSSIASVSKVRMRTRMRVEMAQEALGTLLEVEGGELKTHVKIATDAGTLVEVRELFYNTPARLKFLKSPSNHVYEVLKGVTALALAHPEIHFQLISDEKKLLDCKACKSAHFLENLKERALQIEFFSGKEEGITLHYEEGGTSLFGYLAPPTEHLHNRTGQMLLVNRRPVSSWMLSQSVLEGFGTSLPEGRFPLFILHVEMSQESLDINVHPQKKEVRFRSEMRLKEMIRFAVMSAIGAPIERVSYSLNAKPEPVMMYSSKGEERFDQWVQKSEQLSFFQDQEAGALLPRQVGMYQGYGLLEYSPEEPHKRGLCLFHLARARSRVYYEKHHEKKRGADLQFLAQKVPVELTKLEALALLPKLEALEAAGFLIRAFGEKTFLLEAIPSHLTLEGALLAFKEMVASPGLFDDAPRRFAEYSERFTTSVSEGEIMPLLKELLKCKEWGFSPAGKQIFALVAEEELEKKFK